MGVTNRLLLATAIVSSAVSAFSAPLILVARIGVQTDSVFVGEPFVVRIVTSGMPSRPDTSRIEDFNVEYVNQEWDSSRGQSTFIYRFRALRDGRLEIPPIPIRAGELSTRTPRVSIRARFAGDHEARLHLRLSALHCFVGQRVDAQLTFEALGETGGHSFDVPFLHDERLTAVLLNTGFVLHPPYGYERVRVNGIYVLAEVSSRNSNPVQPRSFTIRAVLIPRRVGAIELPSASVTAHARQRESGPSAKKLFARSRSVTLEVADLPAIGKPSDFSGLVGRYNLAAEAEPQELRLGDPVELTLRLSGQPYVDDAELPPLTRNGDFTEDFRLTGRPSVSYDGGVKVFRYALRPRSDDVARIPPVRYSYFEPASRRYVQAQTDPIALNVATNRVVTANQAEHSRYSTPPPPVPVDYAPGIAYNYVGPELLANQDFRLIRIARSPVWLSAILLPPLAFFCLLASKQVAAYHAWRREHRKLISPLGQLEAELAMISGQRQGSANAVDLQAFDSFRRFLARRLGLPAGSLTFRDVEQQLKGTCAGPDIPGELRRLLDIDCARRYGGARVPDERIVMVIRELAHRLSQALESERLDNVPPHLTG